MSFKSWLSVATALLIIVVLFVSREQLVSAWELLDQINPWILLLLIPVQLIVYYTAGAMMFSYLKAKKTLGGVSPLTMTRLALELNFVNHILPSGGIAGFSYMGWRMRHVGISPARATAAQVVRYVVSFIAFLVLLLIGVVAITLDGSVSRVIILASASLATSIIFGVLFGMYIISNEHRLQSFARLSTRIINGLVRKITYGRNKSVLNEGVVKDFFKEIHNDYYELLADKRLLVRPLLWGFVYVVADLLLFVIAFAALGVWVNPAVLLIAYGLAVFLAFIVVTPGGAGVYEAIMITFLATAGVDQGAAVAGILLARVLLLLGTILSGYLFYQLTIWQYGKGPIKR